MGVLPGLPTIFDRAGVESGVRAYTVFGFTVDDDSGAGGRGGGVLDGVGIAELRAERGVCTGTEFPFDAVTVTTFGFCG